MAQHGSAQFTTTLLLHFAVRFGAEGCYGIPLTFGAWVVRNLLSLAIAKVVTGTFKLSEHLGPSCSGKLR